jgi:FAD:protein FMN transferase
MSQIRLACAAMATRFELVLEGDDPSRLRAAGEEALAGVRRLEAKLSFFRPTSEIGRINAFAAERPVRVDGEVFDLLLRAERYHRETAGAFDVTVGSLMRYWRSASAAGTVPDAALIEEARLRVGMELVELDVAGRSVRFARPGVLIDLGAIGKGYAVEQAMLLLRELGVGCALLHGGTSTVQALGRPVQGGVWRVALEYPGVGANGGEEHLLSIVELRDVALSVSKVTGRVFTAGGVTYGHVVDPRLGWPVQGALLAAVVSPSATEADALSTALLTLGPAGHAAVTARRPAAPMLVLGGEAPHGPYRLVTRGLPVRRSALLEAVEELPPGA